MKVLGLSSNYHDASAALVIDGDIVAAAAEERFTLQKHDPSFPRNAARFCLEQAGLAVDGLDVIAYHEQPEVKFSRTLCSAFAQFPFSLKTFLKSMKEAVTSGLWVRNQISRDLDCDPAKIVYVPHHLSHAAHAFLPSPFEEAAILTVDAVGEWTCTGFFRGGAKDGRAFVDPVDVVPFPHSLGLAYSAFTAFLGFPVNDGECSTMALAAFGAPRYADAVREVIPAQPDGTYRVDLSFFDFSNWEGVPITPKFTERFGLPRPYASRLPFDCLSDDRGSVDADSQRYADVAASVQLVLEERVLALARLARERTGLRDLCLAGGVALNCVATGKLLDSGIFDRVFVPPDPGDGGGAMGAALYADLRATGKRRPASLHPYFGKHYELDGTADMVSHLDPTRWKKYAGDGQHGRVDRPLRATRCASIEETVARAAEALASGKIVGWVQGRFENGPRALGNRSILADPSNLDTARRLSKAVKGRAAFRPYACAVASEDAAKMFERSDAPTVKWMQASRQVAAPAAARVRAALHVDRSTRPQVCSAADNPRFHRLLLEFGRKSGLAALLNTSFNEKGSPMVASPNDALLTFARTDMDMLVIDDLIVERVG
ncbi:MAG: carbamoyl transferase [Elusimicrobia bacterium]|nr:carbamoyl transferase [Elusimicrobiota bacterium]